MAANLAKAKRRSVIWLSFQECTGCLETLLRSSSPTIDQLIFDFISLDYQEALMAAAGAAAEKTLRDAIAANKGEYLLAIDGSIPTKDGGVYSLTGGRSNLEHAAGHRRRRQGDPGDRHLRGLSAACQKPFPIRPARSAWRTSSRTSRSSIFPAVRRCRRC